MPSALCFAEDHTIWVGGEVRGATEGAEAWEYKVIRHYSRDGDQLGESVERSSFRVDYGLGIGWILAAHDRIGVMTYPGKASDPPIWVELDLRSQEIGRWTLSRDDITRRFMHAFTSDARLFASEWDKDSKRSRLLAFDRATSSWQKTDITLNALLLSADGNDLVYWDRSTEDPAGCHLIWIAAPKVRP